MNKKVFLNMNGEIETLSYKKIRERIGKAITWCGINTLHHHKCDTIKGKKVYEVIKKYLGKVSVCDFNCAMEWGVVYLYPHFIELSLKNGATDRRVQE